MIEINPKPRKSLLFRSKDAENPIPLAEFITKVNQSRQLPVQSPTLPTKKSLRRGSAPQPFYRFGSIVNIKRQISAIIKPLGPYWNEETFRKQSTPNSHQKRLSISVKDLTEHDKGSDSGDDDSSETNEQEHLSTQQSSRRPLITLPQRKSFRLVYPLEIVKEGTIKQSQSFGGKEYKIKARPRSNLLSIIALQAVKGPYPVISKIFETALNKVNPEMLVWARYVKSKKKKSRFAESWEKFKKAVMKPLSPESSIILYLDIILFFTILQQAFFSTYLITFVPDGEATYDHPLMIVDYVANLIYIIKILLTFHTGFYDLGEINYRHKSIALNYLKSNFILDAISLLDLLGYTSINNSLKVFQAFSVIRLYRIPKAIQVFEDYFLVSREFSYVIKVMTLALVLFAYGHFLACALYAMAYRYRDNPENWFTKNGFEGQGSGEAYATSLYFALETASTVGYGDIYPGTTGERIFFVPQMIASAILFGYVTSVTGRILAEMGTFSYEARERIRLLKKYMRDKGVHKSTENKIIKYARFFLSRENLARVKDENMGEFLSEDLRDDLIKEVNVKILSQCQMFTYNFRTKFLLTISRALIERAFGPDEMIFRYRDRDDLSVYFLISGRVEAYYARLGLSLGVLEQSGAFGFVSFFDGKSRSNDMRSLEFTTVFQLKRETFLHKLKDFPSERETYYMIKDSMVSYNDYKHLVNVHCILCGEKNHIALVCPLYHWYPNKERVIEKHLRKEKSFARNFKRRYRTRVHALANINIVKNTASRLQAIENSPLLKRARDEEDLSFDFSPNGALERNCLQLPASFTFHSELHQPTRLTINENTDVLDCLKVKPTSEEIERFIRKNYDPYHRNLNIDQVRNYEMYFPHNNLLTIISEWERIRLRNMARMHNVSEKVLHGLNSVFENAKRRKKAQSTFHTTKASNNILSTVFESSEELMVSALTKHKSVVSQRSGETTGKFMGHEKSFREENELFMRGEKSPKFNISQLTKSVFMQTPQMRQQSVQRSSSLSKDSRTENSEGDKSLIDENSVEREKKVAFVNNYQQSMLIKSIEEDSGRSEGGIKLMIPLRAKTEVENELLLKKDGESSVVSRLEGEIFEGGVDEEDKEIEDLKLAMREEFEGLMERMTKMMFEKKKGMKNTKSSKQLISEMKIDDELNTGKN